MIEPDTMIMSRSPYEILGITPDATEEEIRQAYRKLAKKYHPDRNEHPDARAKFIEVSKAGRVLLDQRKRQEYDNQQKTDYTSSRQRKQKEQNQQESWEGWEDIFQEAKESYRQARQESKEQREQNQQESWEGWEDLFEDVKESYRQGKREATEEELSFEWEENIQKGMAKLSNYLGKSYIWGEAQYKKAHMWTHSTISELENEPRVSHLFHLLSYPRRSENRYRTVVLGSVLTLLGVLALPAILVQGYVVRLLRSAAIREEQPPVFEDWIELLQDGLKLSIVNISYIGLSDLLLSTVTRVLLNQISFSPIVRTIISLNMFSIWLFLLYLVPAAQISFAINRSLRASFKFSKILDSALTIRYFFTVVLMMLMGIVFGIISFLLSPVIIGFLIPFYGLMIIYYIFGRRCSRQFRTYEIGS
jgi:hypothetical protein